MKGDFTRDSFDPLKRFSRVLMQQGRVQLDADWNEQTSIVLHVLRRLAADLFPGGGGSGFGIAQLATASPVVDDFAIDPGTYYVNGILCELDATPVPIVNWNVDGNAQRIKVATCTVDGTPYRAGQYLRISGDPPRDQSTDVVARIHDVDSSAFTLTLDADISNVHAASSRGFVRRIVTYRTQPDLPDPPKLPLGASTIYLDVWERLVTSIEDPSLTDPALGGADTSARARVVWQVTTTMRDRTTVTLQARGAPDGGYRGSENRLYRIEISAPSDGAPHFKWSRDNGTVVFPIDALNVDGDVTDVRLRNLGREGHALVEGDLVEVQDDATVLANAAGPLQRVEAIDVATLRVTLAGRPAASAGTDATRHPLLRRWDGGGALAGGDWIDLEDGVQVRFSNADGPVHANDYWLVPARVATHDVMWPAEHACDMNGVTIASPVAKLPDGVIHHYAVLADISLDGTNPPAISESKAEAGSCSLPSPSAGSAHRPES